MLAEQLKTADYLDIIFDNRNKEYGAYLLRRNYSRHLKIALIFTGSIVVCALALSYSNRDSDAVVKQQVSVEVKPEDWKPPVDEPAPPPPPPPPPTPQVRTIKNMVPRIVVDDDVRPEDMPPPVDEVEHARIGNITQAGIDDDLTKPPVVERNSVIATPESRDNVSKEFVPIEIESSFPGGPNAWRRFLLKTLRYPQQAELQFIEGPVAVSFVVDENGVVSDVTAISGPEALRAEAVRVIRASGKWTPALQNGRHVKSSKTQIIIFKLEGGER